MNKDEDVLQLKKDEAGEVSVITTTSVETAEVISVEEIDRQIAEHQAEAERVQAVIIRLQKMRSAVSDFCDSDETEAAVTLDETKKETK